MKPLRQMLLFAVVVAAAARGQEFEYGTPEEMRGRTKLYVDTGADLSARNAIIETLKKELPEVAVVSAVRDMDLLLVYDAKEHRYAASVDKYTGNIRHGRRVTGTALVILPTDSGPLRLLLDIQKTASFIWSRRPSVQVARAFAKEYLKVNPRHAATVRP